MGIGRLNPQYYQSSGESTPQAQMPEQFVSNSPAESPLSDHLTVPYTSYHDFRKGPVVSRVERTNGMRTLYQRGMTRMPIMRLGADGQPVPWTSAANPVDQGPIRNSHFNDAWFQAGYPGFNLGLSFKVPTLNTTNAGSGMISSTPAFSTPGPAQRQPGLIRRASRGVR
jgi:hypothetical protein